MKIIVFGATGRVGQDVVTQAIEAGHAVTAFVRDPRRLNAGRGNISIVEGDARDMSSVRAALAPGFDAVINAIGEAALKPSTVVAETLHAIVTGMKERGIDRLLGVSGVAEMPDKSFLGKLTISLLKITPVGNAIRDHDNAFEELRHSGLKWVLAGCGHIASGARRGHYHVSLEFHGGLKTIHPPDVANFLVGELSECQYTGKVVGIWY